MYAENMISLFFAILKRELLINFLKKLIMFKKSIEYQIGFKDFNGHLFPIGNENKNL